MQVNIYFYHSLKGVRASEGKYIYILELVKDKPVTLTKEGTVTATVNQGELMIILEALGRMTKDCDVNLVGVNHYIVQGIQRIDAWKEADWKTAKGNEIANKDLWQQLEQYIKRFNITAELDKEHTYRNWMRDQVERKLNG